MRRTRARRAASCGSPQLTHRRRTRRGERSIPRIATVKSRRACRDMAASEKPRNPLPTSPMKTLAGGRFHIRNPAAAAANASGTIDPLLVGAAMAYSKAPPPETVTASLAARPSIPSMKFVRLMSQTIYSSAIGQIAQALSTSPNAVIGRIPPIEMSRAYAAAKCVSNRQRLRRCFRSSRNPATATTPPAPANPSTTGQVNTPANARMNRAAKVVSTMAAPPPRGVGCACELRWFGTSSIPRDSA